MSVSTMPFGRYKGRRLSKLPDDYLAWLRSRPDLREPLRSAVDEEWQRRASSDHVPAARVPAEVVDTAAELISAGVRALARRHHPDAGGTHADMLKVNAAADWLCDVVTGATA